MIEQYLLEEGRLVTIRNYTLVITHDFFFFFLIPTQLTGLN